MKVTPIGKNFNKHQVGEVFILPDKIALALIRLGKLREVMQQVESEPAEISARTGKPKRTYKRRDMQAEG